MKTWLNKFDAENSGQFDLPYDDYIKLIRRILEPVPVDELWYRQTYRGVSQGIDRGAFTSGYQHFLIHGYFDGNAPFAPHNTDLVQPPPFAEIRLTNHVVPVRGGLRLQVPHARLMEIVRGLLHAVPVDETWYRKTYPGVDAAITAGEFPSASSHYVYHGHQECRWPFDMRVDATWYIKRYPDVPVLMENGAVSSAREHFWTIGYAEGRFPSPSPDLFYPAPASGVLAKLHESASHASTLTKPSPYMPSSVADVSATDDAIKGVASPSSLASFNLDFTDRKSIKKFLGEGWGEPGAKGVWSIGQQSSLILPRIATSETLLLEIDVQPFVAPPCVTAQLLSIRVNGYNLGWCRIEQPSRVTCRIAADKLRTSSSISIVFEHSCFVRPDLLGVSDDTSLLAFLFHALRLTPEELLPKFDRPLPALPTLELKDPLSLSPADAISPAQRSRFEFGIGKNGLKYLRDGWHIDRHGLTWTASEFCGLDLPLPPGPEPVCIRLGLAPAVIRYLLPDQWLTVTVNGLVLGQFKLRGQTALLLAVPAEITTDVKTLQIRLAVPKAGRLGWFAASEPNQALGIVIDWITLEHTPARLQSADTLRNDGLVPGEAIAVCNRFAGVPSDTLEADITHELGMPVAHLMRSFESLGDNCAFGLAQRKAGAEVLGLLRFANTPFRSLLRALDDSFAGATDPSMVELYLHPSEPREYMLRVAKYGITWHTMIHEQDAEAAKVYNDQTVKLAFLRRKFVEGLQAGRKIYVLLRAQPERIEVGLPAWEVPETAPDEQAPLYLFPAWDAPLMFEEDPEPLRLAEVLSVLQDINRMGANTLLYFVRATSQRPAGTVELLAPGLMRGYLSNFVMLAEKRRDADTDWIRAAANARLLYRNTNGAFAHLRT
jgi:hypothetical protein